MAEGLKADKKKGAGQATNVPRRALSAVFSWKQDPVGFLALAGRQNPTRRKKDARHGVGTATFLAKF